MSKGASSPGDAFELRRIRRLVELMDAAGLSEVDLRQGDMRIRLRRDSPNAPAAATHVPPASTASREPAAPVEGGIAGQPQVAPLSEPGEQAQELVDINSPMVGTFFAASSPDADPYVEVGSQVEPETTVCIIEAMKVFNEIPAEVSGRIAEILVSNGQPVEFGQPLFRVAPSSS